MEDSTTNASSVGLHFTALNCEIVENSSYVRNLTFINNYSDLYGAGIYLYGVRNITFNDIKFLNNTVDV